MYYGVVQYLTFNINFLDLSILLFMLPIYFFLWTMINIAYEDVYGSKSALMYVPIANLYLAYKLVFSKVVCIYIIFLQFVLSLFQYIFRDNTSFFDIVSNAFNIILLIYYFLLISYSFNLILKSRKNEENKSKKKR